MKKIRVFFCETVAELISSHEKTVLIETSTCENSRMMLIRLQANELAVVSLYRAPFFIVLKVLFHHLG